MQQQQQPQQQRDKDPNFQPHQQRDKDPNFSAMLHSIMDPAHHQHVQTLLQRRLQPNDLQHSIDSIVRQVASGQTTFAPLPDADAPAAAAHGNPSKRSAHTPNTCTGITGAVDLETLVKHVHDNALVPQEVRDVLKQDVTQLLARIADE